MGNVEHYRLSKKKEGHPLIIPVILHRLFFEHRPNTWMRDIATLQHWLVQVTNLMGICSEYTLDIFMSYVRIIAWRRAININIIVFTYMSNNNNTHTLSHRLYNHRKRLWCNDSKYNYSYLIVNTYNCECCCWKTKSIDNVFRYRWRTACHTTDMLTNILSEIFVKTLMYSLQTYYYQKLFVFICKFFGHWMIKCWIFYCTMLFIITRQSIVNR